MNRLYMKYKKKLKWLKWINYGGKFFVYYDVVKEINLLYCVGCFVFYELKIRIVNKSW